MLPILVFVGLGWLVWWLTRHSASFPREFALLLDNSEVQGGPLSLLTGRSRVSGTFQGRSVTLHFQRADEHLAGYARVSMQTTSPDAGERLASLRSRADRSDLETSLWALEGTHELRVEIEGGWIRATWQPTGFFIFPGRFDSARWQDVLLQMSIVTSQLEGRTTPSVEMTAAPSVPLSRALPREDSALPASLPARRTGIPASTAGRDGTSVSSPAHSREHRGLGSPILILRLVSGLMILAGLSMLAASVGIGFATELSRGFALATGGFAVIVLGTSLGTFVLAGWPPGLLVNEGDWAPGVAEEQMPLGGWLWLLLLTLTALPMWTVVRLSPLTALWQDILRFLDENEIWEMSQGASELSGLVLFPVLGVLTLPVLELVAALGIVISALGLVVLLVVRSRTFPRTFLISALLLAGLVASAQWAAHAVRALTDLLDPQFFSRGDEQVRTALTRYVDVTRSAANVLTVALAGFLVWLPTLFRSRRVRLTFRR